MSTGQAILAAMTLRIRPTPLNDVAALPAIERAAAGCFRDFPALAWLADGEVISAEQHLDYAERGLSWLALANDQPLEPRHRDHALSSNWKGYRDCHVRPDLVLIYRLDENRLMLARLGSHSELDL